MRGRTQAGRNSGRRLTPHRICLIEGEPGAGKTTVGLQFLLEGLRLGESVVYITLAESGEELHAVARSHGRDIEGIHVHEVLPAEELLGRENQFAIVDASEVELVDTIKLIPSVVEELKRARVPLANPERIPCPHLAPCSSERAADHHARGGACTDRASGRRASFWPPKTGMSEEYMASKTTDFKVLIALGELLMDRSNCFGRLVI